MEKTQIKKTITQIKTERDIKIAKLLDSLGIFYATNNDQYYKNKKEGITYVSDGLGLVIPRQNVKIYYEKLLAILKETKIEIHNNASMDEYINYELESYDCFNSGNYKEIHLLIKTIYPQCTLEDIKRVFYSRAN